MILDWKTLHDHRTPIGQPFYARHSYMSVFCVLESLAMHRLTDAELEATATPYNGASIVAREEITRRQSI